MSPRKQSMTRRAKPPRSPARQPAAMEPGHEPRPSTRRKAVKLVAECSIQDTPALKQTLARHLRVSTPVILDASSVRRIDTASLQLLLAFVLDRAARGRSIGWRGVSASFVDAAQRLGLAELLQVPAAP